MGGWIPVYQQETGITTVVNFTSLPETRLVSRFFRRSSTTCVSSPYPAFARKIIQSLPMSRQTNILWHKKRRPSSPLYNSTSSRYQRKSLRAWCSGTTLPSSTERSPSSKDTFLTSTSSDKVHSLVKLL